MIGLLQQKQKEAGMKELENEKTSQPEEYLENPALWTAPDVPKDIPQGDMPGDKTSVCKAQIQNVNELFPKLLKSVGPLLQRASGKAVLSVYGGSGTGKTGTASLLAWYFGRIGLKSYVISGDNYPRRQPFFNDGERLHLFQEYGIRALIQEGEYTPRRSELLREWQKEGKDADSGLLEEHPWLAAYEEGGRRALKGYLGTEREIDFEEISHILEAFQRGERGIWLKRMGREPGDLWYDMVDFSDTRILILEWTHGNNERLKGVDIPIFITGTPQETLAGRTARNRDENTDSPFTAMVLELEQELLDSQVSRAEFILSREGGKQ